MIEITKLNGKAAVFVRGVVDYMHEHPVASQTLRGAQEYGAQRVKDLGEDISVPYISKLSKTMQDEGIFIKKRSGRKFVIDEGQNFWNFDQWLQNENSEWGLSTKRELSVASIENRAYFLDTMKERGYWRITADEPLDKAAYAIAQQKFKSGQFDIVFIDRDADMNVVYASVGD